MQQYNESRLNPSLVLLIIELVSISFLKMEVPIAINYCQLKTKECITRLTVLLVKEVPLYL